MGFDDFFGPTKSFQLFSPGDRAGLVFPVEGSARLGQGVESRQNSRNGDDPPVHERTFFIHLHSKHRFYSHLGQTIGA